MTSTEKIIDQIRRIRNLMDNAGTEGEAAAAAAAMQRLLSKHNLDLSEIPTGDPEEAEEIDHAMILTQVKLSDYKWKENLLIALCASNFCRAIHTTREGRSHLLIIGKPHNREVVLFLYEILCETLVRLSKAHPTVSPERRDELERAKVAGVKARYTFSPRRSFLYGAVAVLTERLREEYRKFSDTSSNALVLVNTTHRELSIYVNSHWRTTAGYKHSEDSRAQLDQRGYAAGQAAGRTIQFQQGVGAGQVGTKSLGSGR